MVKLLGSSASLLVTPQDHFRELRSVHSVGRNNVTLFPTGFAHPDASPVPDSLRFAKESRTTSCLALCRCFSILAAGKWPFRQGLHIAARSEMTTTVCRSMVNTHRCSLAPGAK